MGRRRLLPNINSMLLRLHLPSSRSNVKDNVNGGVRRNAGVHTTTKTSKKKQQQQQVGDEEASNSPVGSSSTHHHHLYLFSWPSLKRRLSHHKEDQQQREELEHAADVDDSIVDGVLVDIVSVPSKATLVRSTSPTHPSNSSRGGTSNGAVSFGNCEIRTYPQVLGDHPCCSEGCPIQLGWSYTTEATFKVDDYESLVRYRGHCGEQQATRRVLPHELRLTPQERRTILIHAKQQQQVRRSCSSNSIGSTGSSSSVDESKSDDAGDHDNNGNDSHDHGHHHCDQKDRANNCLISSQDGLATSSTTSTTTTTSFEQHERELSRECRRLQRGNINVKASRKRNRRNQQAFFGNIRTISIASVDVGSSNANSHTATCTTQTIETTTTAPST
uniref:Uncharacterized protein n=1 Tax=Pseudo-nitzschia australis TaxID=44445 RepID=A0A6U9ZA55_9STRA|mmetsp:Transcript_26424/g.57901  ORF Transcript_26424/g.57901 Transcript_26424/m.57901 type:complete len:388 (-) Transcript_26424:391-1554(-)|eukprot:CAMPEP_0168184544 /NCGR_PEP_ID=MMETSP0139_2-20121125/13301_1 /TAXON_ID=44445 /ORGANISM="Pseudo-nitzschia australis, Strain 10249 10 AB" /LENGTH=387 /DNA_ID=CAMNT_0008106183 /DNA_START=342 /DNA_END=1505 /DNA_ORIENTATION=+